MHIHQTIDSKLMVREKGESAKKIVMSAKNSVVGISGVTNKIIQEQDETTKDVESILEEVRNNVLLIL